MYSERKMAMENKYTPHQGKREAARRIAQGKASKLVKWVPEYPGFGERLIASLKNEDGKTTNPDSIHPKSGGK